MPVKSDELPPYGVLRDRIRERLSQRDLVRDPRTGKVANLRRIIRGRIQSFEAETGPMLAVDDMNITWRELGRVLESYAGWGLRIEICDCGEE